MSETLVAHRPISRASRVIGEPRVIALVFCVLTAAMLVPVFAFRVPPMADYVNHLARMHVIAFGAADPILDRFYSIHWQIIPNLIMDFLVPPIAWVTGTYAAGQIFIALNLLVTVGGVTALHRAVFGRISPWPMVAFLFLYNHAMIYGFMNFVFASAVALWAMAAWIALRDHPRPQLRAAVSAVFVTLLFFCHLFGIGMYGLGLCAYEAHRLWSRRGRPGLFGPMNILAVQRWSPGDLCALLLPLLPAPVLMYFSPTMGLAHDISWDWAAKFDGLGWLVQAYGHGVDSAFGFALLFALALALLAGIVRFHGAGIVLLVMGAVVYVAMPTVLFGSWAADLRLPVALVFMAIAFADLHLSSPIARRGFMAAILVLALVRFGGVAAAWAEIDRSFDDMRAGLHFIEPGSKILVANANRPTGVEEMNLPLSHAACLAMIERSSLVTTAFAVAGKQVLNVRPDFRAIVDLDDGDPPNVSALGAAAHLPENDALPPAYWRQWTDRYDYVYVLYTAPGDPNPMPDHLELLYEGRNFQLFEVIPPVRPDIQR